MDELVATYDAEGRPSGAVLRSRMRAGNLRHAATAVVVRDGMGRVYVHRRTDTKDVYPGRYDFTAGGVVGAGEDPAEAAVRELAEELGVTGVDLVPIGEGDYADAHTDYRGFCFTATWDGPLRWQLEEVAWGDWVTLERLVELLDSGEWDFVPDTRALLGGWLRERVEDRRTPSQGWDCDTEIVEGRWVDRRPRRGEIARALVAESRLLPRIAPLLPLSVPEPVVLDEDPLRVRHRLVPGEAVVPSELTGDDGLAVGSFLRVLHELPAEAWASTGVPDQATAYAALVEVVGRMRHEVLPLLPGDRVDRGSELLSEAVRAGPTCLVHGDLGPEHLLCTQGRVSGVIDWADTRVLDPALDLAWVLHGTPAAFAAAAATAYGATDALRRRGLVWHRLGPWHEVLFGLDGGGRDYVRSGLAGVVDRLG